MFPKALGEYIIVKPDQIKNTTESGIIIRTDTTQKPFTGTVMSVGEDVRLKKDSHKNLEYGDRVLFKKAAGWHLDHEDEEYLVLEPEHLLGFYPGA